MNARKRTSRYEVIDQTQTRDAVSSADDSVDAHDNSAEDLPIAMKRAVIYLRVSTKEQAETGYTDEGFSIPAQREAGRKRAELLGAVVADEYVDRGESAKSADRPALQAMLQRLKLLRDVDYVIVHKLDRLARSREDDVHINIDVRAAGATLVSCTENIDETPAGKLLHGIMSAMAEHYSANLANEARKGMREKAKQGGTPNRAPTGYLNVREVFQGREIRSIALDPERSPHIEWAFHAYASGDYTTRTLREALAGC
jgi:site-specific DNA recombinase